METQGSVMLHVLRIFNTVSSATTW